MQQIIQNLEQINMYKWLICVLFSALSITSYGQKIVDQVDLDILEEQLGKSINDTVRISLLNQLSEAYITRSPQKALLYNQQALKHATSISNQKGLAKAYIIQGAIFSSQKKPLETIKAYKKADSLYTRLVDMFNKVDCYVLLADVFLEYEDKARALIYLEEGLTIADGNKYTNGIISTATVLGEVYISQGAFKKAENTFKQAITAVGKQKSTQKTTDFLNIHSRYGYAYLSQKKYQQAHPLFQKALKNAQELKDNQEIIRQLHHIGLVAKGENKTKEAVEYFDQSLKMAISGNLKTYLSRNYLNLAQILTQEGSTDQDKGLAFAEKAYETESNYTNPMLARNALGIILEKSENSPDQLESYRKTYNMLNDTIQARMVQKQLGLQRFKLKTQEQKDIAEIQRIHQQKMVSANNQKQWLVLLLFLIGGGLTLLVSRLYLKSKQRKKHFEQSTQDNKTTVAQKDEQLSQLNANIENKDKELKQAQSQINQKDKTIVESEEQTALHQQYIHDSKVFTGAIQKVMLPDIERRRKVLPDHFILFQPKDISSSDFYWVKKVKPYVVMVTADCSGEGVPSAVVGMLAISFLNNIVQNDMRLNAGMILDKLREKVQQTIEKDESDNPDQKGRSEMGLAMLNTDTMELQYAGAYNALHLIRPTLSLKNFQFTANIRSMQKGEYTLLEIKADKQPVGHFMKEKPFNTQRLALQKDDKLYMFTNGYVDQPNYKNRLFNKSQLKTLLLEIHDKPMAEQEAILSKTFADWKGDRPQIDDLLVMGVHIDQDWFQMYMQNRTAFY